MKNQIPTSNELATDQDLKQFVLPYLTPDELDDFVSFITLSGYDIHKYSTAHDSFKKSIFNCFLSMPEGQTVKSRLYPQKLT